VAPVPAWAARVCGCVSFGDDSSDPSFLGRPPPMTLIRGFGGGGGGGPPPASVDNDIL
jgi:hypothetical protein